MDLDPKVEKIFYSTVDPENDLGGMPIPALTTLLLKVCDNDQTKFDEATRLVGLFISKALEEN